MTEVPTTTVAPPSRSPRVGGIPLERLAERVGSTPFFAYDRALLSDRVGLLRSTLPAEIELGYAVKANPMPAVVQHLSGLVDSFDVASAGEMKVALDTPMPAARVSFAGPGKTPAELAQAIAAGVTIELESETEAARVAEIGERLGIRPRVAIRVNPDFRSRARGCGWAAARSSSASTPSASPPCSTRLAEADLELLGFHVFAGSQNLNAEILCEAQRATVALALRLAETRPAPIRYLNIGGGFGIPYFERDQPLDLGRDRREPRRPAGRRDPAQPPRRARGGRARPLHRRRMRLLRDPDRRPQAARAARPSWSSTVACTTSSRPRATSAR